MYKPEEDMVGQLEGALAGVGLDAGPIGLVGQMEPPSSDLIGESDPTVPLLGQTPERCSS